MRVSQEEKIASRQRIIRNAKEIFKSKGIEKSSVAVVMEAAGLTHGGFYRHFDDKKQLVEIAIQSSFADISQMLKSEYQVKPPAKVLGQYSELYLSKEHLDNPQVGCPMASLASELAKDTEDYKKVFSDGFKEIIHELKHSFDGSNKDKEQQAMRHMAMMVGAVVIARASDSDTAKKILDSCRSKKSSN